jgi:periplasmic divalent cation tolerance protein
MTDFIQVVTTASSRDEAQRLAEVLVDGRLAACVQVLGPITSTYWWQGVRESAEEWQCVAKTHQRLYAEVESAIRAHHSYTTPEILALPVLAGHADYLAWLEAELKPRPTTPSTDY